MSLKQSVEDQWDTEVCPTSNSQSSSIKRDKGCKSFHISSSHVIRDTILNKLPQANTLHMSTYGWSDIVNRFLAIVTYTGLISNKENPSNLDDMLSYKCL